MQSDYYCKISNAAFIGGATYIIGGATYIIGGATYIIGGATYIIGGATVGATYICNRHSCRRYIHMQSD